MILKNLRNYLGIGLLVLLMACNATSNNEIATDVATEIVQVLPTDTPVPPVTDTPEPPTATVEVVQNTATPLPGDMVYPIDAMNNSIPWLSNSSIGRPLTFFFGFNMNQAPFRSSLVRKAFAAATDRETIADLATYLLFENVTPATTMLSPLILGRDLYEDVGIPFDPEQARAYMAEAGYTDISKFPPIVVVTSFADSEIGPGAFLQFTDALVEMWQENLGVTIEVKKYATAGEYFQFLGDYPTNYDVYRLLYASEYEGPGLDPSHLMDIFTTGHFNNYSNFTSTEYDQLMDNARNADSAEERMGYYLEAERLLSENLSIIIPIFHATFPNIAN